jgi:hypothetical protein
MSLKILIFKNTHAYDRNQDVNPDETKYSGDRIATFMFYSEQKTYSKIDSFYLQSKKTYFKIGSSNFRERDKEMQYKEIHRILNRMNELHAGDVQFLRFQ